MWQTTTKLVNLYDNYQHMRVDQDKDLKGNDKEFQDIYKFKESAREAVAITDSKRLTVEHTLAEAEAARDEAFD